MSSEALWTESAVGLGCLDAKGRFASLNPALEMLLGASSRVAAGESLTRYFPDMTGFERFFSEHARVELTTRLVPGPGEEKKGWTVKGDPRVTKVGGFLRRTSIDELPQLFNVLKGDMSLVGPRPERPQFVEKFKEEIPRYMIKHQVRPGMTGWAQINGYRGDTSIRERIEHDLYYIENWNILFDVKILLMTLFRAVNRSRQAPSTVDWAEATLSWAVSTSE